MTVKERISKMTKKELQEELNTWENIIPINKHEIKYLNALWTEATKREYNITMIPRKIILE